MKQIKCCRNDSYFHIQQEKLNCLHCGKGHNAFGVECFSIDYSVNSWRTSLLSNKWCGTSVLVIIMFHISSTGFLRIVYFMYVHFIMKCANNLFHLCSLYNDMCDHCLENISYSKRIQTLQKKIVSIMVGAKH